MSEIGGRKATLTGQSLGHDAEGGPGVPLVGVVGARNVAEEKGERIFSGHRNFSLSGSWWTQVTQSNVNRVVAVLVQLQEENKMLEGKGTSKHYKNNN